MSKTSIALSIILLISNLTQACDPYNATNLSFLPDPINCETLFNSGTYRGKGSFGQVNTIKVSGKNLAIKKIKLARNSSAQKFSQKYNMALHEIKILKSLTLNSEGKKFFPNFYGCGFKGSKTNGPMEIYVIQEVLYKDLQKDNALTLIKNVTPKDRIHLYLELAQGLAYLHNLNYVHSDLKPENMMTNISARSKFEDLHFKIIDFGMTNTTSKYVMGGSPVYNSPEKINGDSYNRFAHDVWAYGLTVAAIESKSSYLFNGIGNSCFLDYFSKQCGVQLLTKVGSVMNTVFGAGSAFGKVIKGCLIYDRSKRLEIKDVVKKIESILKDEEKLLEGDDMTTTVNKKDNFKLKGTEAEKFAENERIRLLKLRAKDLRDENGNLEKKIMRNEKEREYIPNYDNLPKKQPIQEKPRNQILQARPEKIEKKEIIDKQVFVKKYLHDKYKIVEEKNEKETYIPRRIIKKDLNNDKNKMENFFKKAGEIENKLKNEKREMPAFYHNQNLVRPKNNDQGKRPLPKFIDANDFKYEMELKRKIII